MRSHGKAISFLRIKRQKDNKKQTVEVDTHMHSVYIVILENVVLNSINDRFDTKPTVVTTV